MTIFDDFREVMKDVLVNPRFGIGHPQYVIPKGMVDLMNPSLDYLNQYPVKQVLAKKDGSGYAIEFGGDGQGTGAVIGVEAGEHGFFDQSEIPDLADKVLVMTIYSATETRMVFGNVTLGANDIDNRVEVVVAPVDYFIIDPRFDSGEPFYPGAPQLDTDPTESIRDQFNDRFAEGPDVPADATPPENVQEAVEDANGA